MGRAWRWWGFWVVVGVCLWGAGKGVAECRYAAAKGRVWDPDVKGQGWTWKDADGCVRTRAELEEVLAQHKLWIDSDHIEGHRADFTGAILIEADLTKAGLEEADFTGANLSKADLSSAFLYRADLTNTNIRGADLTDAYLSAADLTGAYLNKADLTGASLVGTDLSGAHLEADLSGVYYEPKEAPAAEYIAYALELDRLLYDKNPAALAALRKSFQDAGFVQQARELTASIRRHDESWPERILFDWTCAWGADWVHPLVLLGWLCLVCGPVYWVGMHFGGVGGIYQIVLDEVVATKAAKEVVTRVGVGVRWVERRRLGTRTVGSVTRARRAGLRWRLVAMAWRAEWRALRLAFLFSVLSALDIGFHEFNVGQWARMLLARDFNLKARGWMRVAGGVQSLVGLGLVALSLLSYFGHPFD